MRLIERVLLLTVASVSFAGAQDDPPGRVGRLNYISGTVSFQPAGVDDWVAANLNRPLTTGDHLWVDQNSRAELHLGSSALRLNARSAFQFLNLDDRNVQIRLSEGTLVVRLRRLDKDEAFEVDTPNLAFSIFRPGEYRIDANPDNETTTITVRSGEGEVSGGSQTFPLRADQMVRVTGDQTLTYDVLGAQSPDYFEEWALARDRQEDRSESARYVSRDVIGYEDLDTNGDWIPEPEFGTVWVPRRIPAGWAPYRFGHWAWIEPWGWTWVDDAPWGFAPFHYGRWAFITGAWAWVPGPIAVRPVYAPALVAWVGGPRFSLAIAVGGGGGVGWFPLGPREVYRPAYRASPTYVNRVNITNTNITNINVTSVYNNTNVNNVRYVNQNVPNAVTAVPRDALMHSRSIAQAALPVQAQALQNADVVRTAEVAPSRESVLGRRAASAPVPRPPETVMNRPVVARATPPPPQVPFDRRQQALAANPGQPLDRATVSRIRSEQPQPAAPLVRQTNVMPVNAGGRRAGAVGDSGNAAPQNSAPVLNQPGYRANPSPNLRGAEPANAARQSDNPPANNEPNRGREPGNAGRQNTPARERRIERAQPPDYQQPPNAQPPSRRLEATPTPDRPVRQPVERAVQPPQERQVQRQERPQPPERREARSERPAEQAKPEKPAERENAAEKEKAREDGGRRRP